MKHNIALASCLVLIISSCQPKLSVDRPIGSVLQTALDHSIENSGAIGVSAAVMFPNGDLWTGTVGESYEGTPLTKEMLFDIASVQKNLQAALVLKLVEDSILALDDPIAKWLPPSPHIDGAITVRQLLNLSSGIDTFVGDPNSPFRIGYQNIDFEKSWTWEEILAAFVGEPHFEPGSKREYSTTNYIVLRQIIEKATQSRQTRLLADTILLPNGLNHTLADFSNPIPESLCIAHGWVDTDHDGQPEDISHNSLNWIASLSPMLVYSTPSDMVRWMDALFHREVVLHEGTLKEMLTFAGPVQGEPLMKAYGLGVADIALGALLPQWEHVRIYGHLGLQFGYMTLIGYLPESGVSIAIMSNRGGDLDSDRAMLTVGGAMLDVLLRHLGAEEAKQTDSLADLIKESGRSPDDMHLMYRIARLHQAQNDDDEAALVFAEILKRDPEDRFGYRIEALYWKAVYDGLIGRKPEPLISFISEHDDFKDIKEAYKYLAKTYLRRGEMDKAIGVYEDALKTIGVDADFYNHYAWWVFENKVKSEYDVALDLAKQAAEKKPDAFYIWDTVAWLYLEIGDQDLAILASKKALERAPANERPEMEDALAKIRKGKRK